jgi:hypothetical protein
LRQRRSSSSVGLLMRWTPGPPAFGLSHLLGLVSGARLNAKHTAIYISHITSSRQIEQDERVAKGIIDDGESANPDLSRLEDHPSARLEDPLNGLRHRRHQPIHGVFEVGAED